MNNNNVSTQEEKKIYVQRTPYKIVLQMHVLFEILTATVQLNFYKYIT